MSKRLRIVGLLPTAMAVPAEGTTDTLLAVLLERRDGTAPAAALPRLLGALDDQTLVQLHLQIDGTMQAYSLAPREAEAIKSARPFAPPGAGGSPPPSAGILEAAGLLARRDAETSSAQAQAEPPTSRGDHSAADRKRINNPLSPFAQAVAGQGLASVIESGDWRDIYRGLRDPSMITRFFIGQLLSKLTGNLMSGWKLDDESGTAEFVARAAADRAMAEAQSFVLDAILNAATAGAGPDVVAQLKAFFGPVTSNATAQVAAAGDPDDCSNRILVPTQRNVVANSAELACALSHDQLSPPQKPIVVGTKCVRIGGDRLMLAHEGSATAVPSKVSPGLHNVLVAEDPPNPRAADFALGKLQSGASPNKATQECERVDKVAATAAHIADLRQMSPEERAQFVQNAIDQSTRAQQADPKRASALQDFCYRTGAEGLLGPAKRPIKPGELAYYNSTTGEVYSEGELRALSSDQRDAVRKDLEEFVVLEVNTQVPNVWTNPETAVDDVIVPGNPDLPSGYRSVLFQSTSSGQRYGVYGGTDDGVDWVHNFAQGLGLRFDGLGALGSSQYQQAKDDALRWFEGDAGTVLIGHSLGGGLATYGGAMTGALVTALNPAGLGSTSIADVQREGRPITPGQFQVYMIDNDILTVHTTRFGQPAPFGDLHIIKNATGSGILRGHVNETIRSSLWPGEEVQVEYLGYVEPTR